MLELGGDAAEVAFPWTIVPALAVGEKRSGYLTWSDTALHGWEWPYIAVRGREPGRSVVVTAAVHGGEYPGVLGALRLGRLFNPDRVRGSLLILPIVNPPAFRARSAFVTPLDGHNLNRQFPGFASGTFSGDARLSPARRHRPSRRRADRPAFWRCVRDVGQPYGLVSFRSRCQSTPCPARWLRASVFPGPSRTIDRRAASA